MKIIQDTREKYPWDFRFYGYDQEIKKLDAGDYALTTESTTVIIERKRNTGELALNLGVGRERFFREINKLQYIPLRFIICEFTYETLNQFPKNSGIPQSSIGKIRMNKQFMINSLNSINEKYQIPVIYAGSRENAILAALEIFDNVRNK